MEREYIVPLRKEAQKAPRYKRTNRAVKALRSFIQRHMKSEKVSIGRFLNTELWKNGIKNPPARIAVKAVKSDDGKVSVELRDLPMVREKVNKRLARVEGAEAKKAKEAKKAEEAEKKAKAKPAKKEETTETPKAGADADARAEKKPAAEKKTDSADPEKGAASKKG
ncbi:MAG: 50S ribosomal protein L31e [Nanoarchaeota archaeon]